MLNIAGYVAMGQLADGKVPDFDGLILGAGDDGGLEGVGGEPNAADPTSVVLAAADSVLALDAETICLLWTEKATKMMSVKWPMKRRLVERS